MSSPFSTKILLSTGDLTACRFYRANVPHDTFTYSLVDILDVGNIVDAIFHKNFVVGRRLDCMSLIEQMFRTILALIPL